MSLAPPFRQEPVNSFGDTRLLMAARNNDLEGVKKLIAEGTDAAAANLQGKTALHHASLHGNIGMMSLLLEHGASVNAKTECGSTPLQHAVFQRRHEAVELLFTHGALADIADNKERTPLHWAAAGEDYAMAKILLSHGANPNAVGDDEKETPLISSCRKGQGRIVPALLVGNADPNIPDMHGATALHHAALLHNPSLCELFIKHGANPALQDNGGFTACSRWPEVEAIHQRVREKARASLIAENHARMKKIAAARPWRPSL